MTATSNGEARLASGAEPVSTGRHLVDANKMTQRGTPPNLKLHHQQIERELMTMLDVDELSQYHRDLLYDLIGEWGSNRFGYSFKRAHFTEKAVKVAEAIGRSPEDVVAVFRRVVEDRMREALGPYEEVPLSNEELVEIQRGINLYLFSYGFPYGVGFPSEQKAMRAYIEQIAQLIEVPVEKLYPVWAALVFDSIEWSFEPIPEDFELPNDNDWRERL